MFYLPVDFDHSMKVIRPDFVTFVGNKKNMQINIRNKVPPMICFLVTIFVQMYIKMVVYWGFDSTIVRSNSVSGECQNFFLFFHTKILIIIFVNEHRPKKRNQASSCSPQFEIKNTLRWVANVRGLVHVLYYNSRVFF